MEFLKNFLRRLHDHNSDQKQQRNRTLLSAIGDGDANAKHIGDRNAARHEATRLTHVALRHMKEDRQKAQAQIELYLDDWMFHNGPINTQAQFQRAIRDCVDRIKQRHRAAQQLAEDRAEDGLTGLKEFPF